MLNTLCKHISHCYLTIVLCTAFNDLYQYYVLISSGLSVNYSCASFATVLLDCRLQLIPLYSNSCFGCSHIHKLFIYFIIFFKLKLRVAVSSTELNSFFSTSNGFRREVVLHDDFIFPVAICVEINLIQCRKGHWDIQFL